MKPEVLQAATRGMSGYLAKIMIWPINQIVASVKSSGESDVQEETCFSGLVMTANPRQIELANAD